MSLSWEGLLKLLLASEALFLISSPSLSFCPHLTMVRASLGKTKTKEDHYGSYPIVLECRKTCPQTIV